MIVPLGAPTIAEAVRYGAEVFHALGKAAARPRSADARRRRRRLRAAARSIDAQALDLLLAAIETAGYKPANDVAIALDPASSEFYRDGKYYPHSRPTTPFELDEMVALYEGLCERYPIVSIEDGLAEDDWDGWQLLTDALGERVQLVGDDLFVTNVERLERGIDEGVANAILIKVNQIGTLTETLDAVEMAHKAGFRR